MESRINPPTEELDKPQKNNTWIYITIIALLLATNIYLFLQKKSSHDSELAAKEEVQKVSSEKDMLQNEYNAALARLDNLTSQNTALKEKVAEQSSELQHIKERISTILAKSNATKTELKEAKSLILGLNQRISGYESQIAILTKENTALALQRDSMASANDSLKARVDMGRILHASNIRLQPIFLRKGGRKESVTAKATKVDLLRILFDIDENMLAESGAKEFDIRIVNPDGTLLSNAALGSGSFIDNNGKTQYYSLSKTVNITSGMPLHNIDVDWRQASSYKKGAYLVEIYYEGYLIGQGTTTLQ